MPKPEWISKRAESQKRNKVGKLYLFQVGETPVKIDVSQPPREHDFGNGKRAIYTAEIDGKTVQFAASKSLDALIMHALIAEINPFTLVREGIEFETEYTIKELK